MFVSPTSPSPSSHLPRPLQLSLQQTPGAAQRCAAGCRRRLSRWRTELLNTDGGGHPATRPSHRTPCNTSQSQDTLQHAPVTGHPATPQDTRGVCCGWLVGGLTSQSQGRRRVCCGWLVGWWFNVPVTGHPATRPSHRTPCNTSQSQDTLQHVPVTGHPATRPSHRTPCNTSQSQDTLQHVPVTGHPATRPSHRTPCNTSQSQDTLQHVPVTGHPATRPSHRTPCNTAGHTGGLLWLVGWWFNVPVTGQTEGLLWLVGWLVV